MTITQGRCECGESITYSDKEWRDEAGRIHRCYDGQGILESK